MVSRTGLRHRVLHVAYAQAHRAKPSRRRLEANAIRPGIRGEWQSVVMGDKWSRSKNLTHTSHQTRLKYLGHSRGLDECLQGFIGLCWGEGEGHLFWGEGEGHLLWGEDEGHVFAGEGGTRARGITRGWW